MKIKKILFTRTGRIFIDGLWRDNPVTCMVLGICSVLAITNKVENTLAMSASVIIVLTASSFLVSLIRKFIPDHLRIMTYMIIISTFVVCVDQLLKAFLPLISRSLGPYVGLIITNCIIMGRAEAFACRNTSFYSLIDALAVGIGYSYIILIISVIRELLAFGTTLGIQVMPENWVKIHFFSLAPGAFIVLAVIIWIFKSIRHKNQENV